MNRIALTLTGVMLALLATMSSAATLAGRLDDPLNTALVGSDLGAASFADDLEVANNVALYEFTVVAPGMVSIVSTGFAGGGIDPYFSLFTGVRSSATFLYSNYDQAYATGGDFTYSAMLSAGKYQLALGTFANMSFAENLGGGSLSDGFIGLGQPGALGDASYRLTLTTPVPEPSSALMLALGGAVLLRMRRPTCAADGRKAPATSP